MKRFLLSIIGLCFFVMPVMATEKYLVCDPQQGVTHYEVAYRVGTSWNVTSEIVQAQQDTTLRYDVDFCLPGETYNFSVKAIRDVPGEYGISDAAPFVYTPSVSVELFPPVGLRISTN